MNSPRDKTDKQVADILSRAVATANEQLPSEEITYIEMMENIAHAKRLAEHKKGPTP